MSGIEVCALEPTMLGKLYPHIDPEIKFLYLQTAVTGGASHTVNVGDGVLTFALDGKLRLRGATLRRVPNRWTITEPHPECAAWMESQMPEVRDADIEFKTKTVEQKYFADLEVKTTTDLEFSHVWIILGEAEATGQMLRLSEHCLAMVSGESLGGFYVRLSGLVSPASH
jgi:hypothetical protein